MNHLTIAIKNDVKEKFLTEQAFAEQYIRLRIKEGRLYSDEEVRLLPVVKKSHPHYAEWLIRKRSCAKMSRYIRRKNTSPDILEIGCGNGWLSAQMAQATTGKVTGIDVNTVEIEQAKRVFTTASNCRFMAGSLDSGILGEDKFDLIIFAASVQYFKSLKATINKAFEHLTLQGEIHIIDSKLYNYIELAGARERSLAYFTSMGFPDMAHHYYHHCITMLGGFQRTILHEPGSWLNKFAYPANPFHWIVIKNSF